MGDYIFDNDMYIVEGISEAKLSLNHTMNDTIEANKIFLLSVHMKREIRFVLVHVKTGKVLIVVTVHERGNTRMMSMAI